MQGRERERADTHHKELSLCQDLLFVPFPCFAFDEKTYQWCFRVLVETDSMGLMSSVASFTGLQESTSTGMLSQKTKFLFFFYYWISLSRLSCYPRLNALPFLSLLSGVLKDYLRELPYPLINKPLYEAVLETMAVRPLKMGAAGCENNQADSEHTVSLLENLPEVERVRDPRVAPAVLPERKYDHRWSERADLSSINLDTA